MMGGGHDFLLHKAELAHGYDDSCRKTQYQPHYLRAVVDMGRYINSVIELFPLSEHIGHK
jgi:hypothetical protein